MNPIESFVACLEAEGKAGTDNAKFPPITFTVADQGDLRMIHTLASLSRSKPSAYLRRLLRSRLHSEWRQRL